MLSKLSENVVGLFAVVVFGLLLGAGVTIAVLFLLFICLPGQVGPPAGAGWLEAVWEHPTPFVYVAIGLGVVVFLGVVGIGVKLLVEPRDGAS